MTQADKARAFKALHRPGDPLVLYNIWDAGSARAVVEAGASAVATGSWSVAAAQGYGDGQAIPLDFLLRIAARIAESVEVPFTLDFEGGYATAPEDLGANIRAVIAAGAVGINFEDQVVGGQGLHPVEVQAARIRAVRAAADAAAVPLFINARTDLFLKSEASAHAGLVDEAISRAAAYAEAGADGFFVPALGDHALIRRVCEAVSLPVNVMVLGQITSVAELAPLGVARASFGPGPYRKAMADLSAACAAIT